LVTASLGLFEGSPEESGGQGASEDIILTEDQVAALECKKHDDVACGEIETAHPGYLGSQDTFYVEVLVASTSRPLSMRRDSMP